MNSDKKESASGQNISISAGRDVIDTTIAQGSITKAQNSSDTTGGDEVDAQLLGELAQILKDAGPDGEAAFAALREELDKAREGNKPEEFRLAGIIGQIAKIAPTAAKHLVCLFAPAVWGNLAKGAVKTAVDNVSKLV